MALTRATTKKDRDLLLRVVDMIFDTRRYWAEHPRDDQIEFECHSISMAISMAIPELELVHGVFLGLLRKKRKGRVFVEIAICDHSWLKTPSGAIIDPYPVGQKCLGAVLVPTKGVYKKFGGNLYCQEQKRKFCISRKEIRRKAMILLRTIKKAKKDSSP